MNKLKGNIDQIQSGKNISVVSVRLTDGTLMQSIVVDTPQTEDYLQEGKEVELLFKETNVILAQDELKVGELNQLAGSIGKIEKGEIMCRVSIVLGNENIVVLLPTNSFNQLNLEEKAGVKCIINTHDIMLIAI